MPELPEEVEEVFAELGKAEDEIIARAKKEGKWAPGLDSNKELFEEAHARARKKLAEIAEKHDQEKK